MKKFYSLFLTTLLVFGLTTLQAQDKNNPWQFSFGANAIDVEADTNTQFADFFDVDENWNTAKSPISMFTISKYIGPIKSPFLEIVTLDFLPKSTVPLNVHSMDSIEKLVCLR